MKKTIISMLLACVFLLSSTTGAFAAATGEGAVRVATVDNYYGVSATLTIPSSVVVPSDNTSYIAFYTGLGERCEGGISYKNGLWRKFLNCGGGENDTGSNESLVLSTQPTAGTTYIIKLVNNLDNTASLYFNGSLQFTKKVFTGTLLSATPVKVVHSTYDLSDKNAYSNATFSNIEVRSSSGVYSAFPSNIQSNIYPWGKGDYSVPSLNPLQTSLKAGN
ncbi:hypothetical protein [Paenibacillus alba]|uniref:DUF4397 domain-containing protein n=1 Tax=Paenibacillus alba TaxID=1197127 RepID=A0ABU6GIS4_9BACL|nr:hypothetical protein [Paenibacillus alba]MEC0232554.1 hypothetical protein [Paenibacillus alba]